MAVEWCKVKEKALDVGSIVGGPSKSHSFAVCLAVRRRSTVFEGIAKSSLSPTPDEDMEGIAETECR